jgi:DNA-binding NtrC family response regulator
MLACPMADNDTSGLTTVHRPRPAPHDAPQGFVLRVASGPDEGATLTIEASQPGRVLVGTSPACNLRLTDREVSRRHGAFEIVGQDVHLTDLRSTNGTRVNGVAVVEAVLQGGESIHLGSTVLSFERVASKQDDKMSTSTSFGRVVGGSAAMRRLYPLCERLAQANVAVLIEGETGTGKELLAESLHEASLRAQQPFVVFDCAAVAPNLIESHLFGHERGAFTGATSLRRGVFELAHGGTLFIDEIGDLDIALQARLLRAIERGEVGRVGSERWQKVDVRILAATRRDLDREVQEGRFRDDLFYRLAVARIELPPLRHRHGDIGRLARHFWDALGGGEQPIPYELFERFEDYAWPGNIRELHNTVARRLALGELAEDEQGSGARAPADVIAGVLSLDLPLTRAKQRLMTEFERMYVERVLAKYQGDVGKAAAASGIARRYFNLLRAKHGT